MPLEYTRTLTHVCLQQYYKRRKANANCYVGSKFIDPVEHQEDCPCADEDYEWFVVLILLHEPVLKTCSDYNFIRQGDKCVPAGPEPIPAGVCLPDDTKQTFLGSSGFRLIPGNTCDKSKGKIKDQKVEKPCSKGMPCTVLQTLALLTVHHF